MFESKREDLTGREFGRLSVIEFSHVDIRGIGHWLCACICGQSRVAASNHLRSGHTKSCGCYRRELVSKKNTSHGKSTYPEYSVWRGMLRRCTDRNDAYYSYYGGRGITVCHEWLSFEQFYVDMGPRPSKDHSIDRIDNDGNSCKENCRWVTLKEQQNNRRSNRMLTCNGKTRTLTQWADELGISRDTLKQRLERGWSDEDTLTIPVKSRNRKGG